MTQTKALNIIRRLCGRISGTSFREDSLATDFVTDKELEALACHGIDLQDPGNSDKTLTDLWYDMFDLFANNL